MHFKLTPVRLDKLTERVSIPALSPSQEVGSHAAIVPQTFASRPPPPARRRCLHG
jgi:hypothetical protein